MASVTIVLGRAKSKYAENNDPMPVPNAAYDLQQDMTSSGTSQATTITATDKRQFWSVTATGGDIRVLFATAPVVTAATGWKVLDGQTREFGAEVGQKAAIIDA
jgi:hypothetical protein